MTIPDGEKDVILSNFRSYVDAQYALLDLMRWLPYRHIMYCAGSTQKRQDGSLKMRLHREMNALKAKMSEEFEEAERKRAEELIGERNDRHSNKDARYSSIVGRHDDVLKVAASILPIEMWYPDPNQQHSPIPGHTPLPSQSLTRATAPPPQTISHIPATPSQDHPPQPTQHIPRVVRVDTNSARPDSTYSTTSSITIRGDAPPPVPPQPARAASPAPTFASDTSTIAPNRPPRSHQHQRTGSGLDG